MADNFSLGSTQYSILEPSVFTQLPENKGKWVLMDGQSINGSDLWKLIPAMENVPDGRGVFIRAMNLPKVGEDMTIKGDTELDRPIGSYQPDSFKSHQHHFSRTDGDGGYQLEVGTGWNRFYPGVDALTSLEGGSETRPRNIALYLYIKINN